MRAIHANSLANLTNARGNGIRYSYTQLAKMTRRMMDQKFTVSMLAKYAGISWSSANRWTTSMHKQGCVHIVEYLRSKNGRTTSRVYQWGVGDDVPKPAKLPSREYHRKWRAKRKTLEGAWRGVGA